MNATRKPPKKVVRVVFASAYRRLDNKVNREKKQSNLSNENNTTSRNIAIWPARSARASPCCWFVYQGRRETVIAGLHGCVIVKHPTPER